MTSKQVLHDYYAAMIVKKIEEYLDTLDEVPQFDFKEQLDAIVASVPYPCYWGSALIKFDKTSKDFTRQKVSIRFSNINYKYTEENGNGNA
jgi:hypothetical protein